MEKGLPVALLLLFAVLIWILYLLILASSPGNKVNQWCCICGLLLSIGVWKEFLYHGGFLEGILVHIGRKEYEADELVNSLLTAVLYYAAMPCGLICSFYFCGLDRSQPRVFPFLKAAVFLPLLVFSFHYPWYRTREIALEKPEAYQQVAVYNLACGLVMTILIFWTLWKEKKSFLFPQKKIISLLGLLPLWYWLITVFLFHLLGLEQFDKAWQGNALIILYLLGYYLYHLFSNGIWGLRLTREYFEWSDEMVSFSKSTSFIIHMLKNEMSKIKLSAQLIREAGSAEISDELDIIGRSVAHIEEFIQRSNQYMGNIRIEAETADLCALIRETVKEQTSGWNGRVAYDLDERDPFLYCDPYHIKEVLCNLISNALDAMKDGGTLTVSYQTSKRDVAVIRVADTGSGIEKKDLERIFDLYYTGYSDFTHFGMGLAYCRNVVRAHRGCINVKSNTDPDGHGSEFTLYLPRRFHRRWIRDGIRDQGADC